MVLLFWFERKLIFCEFGFVSISRRHAEIVAEKYRVSFICVVVSSYVFWRQLWYVILGGFVHLGKLFGFPV